MQAFDFVLILLWTFLTSVALFMFGVNDFPLSKRKMMG